jgi:uncharacterized protein (DUF2147 family)
MSKFKINTGKLVLVAAAASLLGTGQAYAQSRNYQQSNSGVSPAAMAQYEKFQGSQSIPNELRYFIQGSGRGYPLPTSELQLIMRSVGGLKVYYDARMLTPDQDQKFVKVYDLIVESLEYLKKYSNGNNYLNSLIQNLNKSYSDGLSNGRRGVNGLNVRFNAGNHPTPESKQYFINEIIRAELYEINRAYTEITSKDLTFTTQANKIANFKKTHSEYFPVTKEVVAKYGNDGLQVLRAAYNKIGAEDDDILVVDGTNQQKYYDLKQDFYDNITAYKSYLAKSDTVGQSATSTYKQDQSLAESQPTAKQQNQASANQAGPVTKFIPAASESWLKQLDGNWSSKEWKYGYQLKNGVGIATATNSPNFRVGQKIIQLTAKSATSFVGQQVYKDGKFYNVKVTLQPDGRLYFEGEKNAKWYMER